MIEGRRVVPAIEERLGSLPDAPPIVLVHGAANSAGVWCYWQEALACQGYATYAIDLRGHGANGCADLAVTTMADYASDVMALVDTLGRKPIVMGWSMGGLVAMIVAASGASVACVALAPSLPARSIDASAPLRTGVFGAEVYGITGLDPDNQPEMPDLDRTERMLALSSLALESTLARDERRRGVIIEHLPCPTMIVTGSIDRQWPAQRYAELWFDFRHLDVAGASHWGLVLNRAAVECACPILANWLTLALADSQLGSRA